MHKVFATVVPREAIQCDHWECEFRSQTSWVQTSASPIPNWETSGNSDDHSAAQYIHLKKENRAYLMGLLQQLDQKWKDGKITTCFPGGSVVKDLPVMLGDLGLNPGLGRSSGEGNGNSLQYSCLENPHGQKSLAGYSPQSCKESQ